MLIPFGEWLPDAPSYGNAGVGLARNVVPLSDPMPGYGPAKSFVASGAVLADDPPMFLNAVRSPSATSYLFAASPSAIYRSTDSGFTFTKVSWGEGATPYEHSSTPTWDAALFGDSYVMTNYDSPPQVFDLRTGTHFAQLSANAPRAKCVTGAKNFLVFANVVDEDGEQPARLRWSGLDRIDYFPPVGSTDAIEVQSDRQDMLNDGGPIQRVVAPLAGADFLVVQENALVRATYVGAEAGIFQFDDLEGSRGAISGGAVLRSGNVVHYWSADGYMICDGVTSQPGGAGKVDQWVFDRLKLDDAWRIQGVVDPRRKLIRWLLPSKATGKLDLMVVLNEATGWWAYCDGYDLGVLGHSITTAKLVDDIDELLDGSDISELRLDDPIWSGDNIRSLAAFDSTGRFGSLSGPALEAEIMTSERQLADGQQALVNELWPLVDGAPAEAALGTRKTLGQPIVWTGYKAPNRVGFCPLRGRSSYHSARVRVPAGVDWKFAQGVRMPFRPAGRG